MSLACKRFSLPLSAITFIVNSHADNHFYKYIYLFQILYSMKWVFFIKMHVKVFHIHKNSPQKKLIMEKNSFFASEYVKIIEFYIAHTWRHLQTDWNVLDQFGIPILYFLEVGARVSLKVTMKGSLRGKKTLKIELLRLLC